MYQSLIGEKVSVVVSSRGDKLLEYIGTLSSETEDTIELANVSISYLMSAISGFNGYFFNKDVKYRDDVKKAIINKKYIISCDK